ncbi:hypothetical protein [Chitinophaga sp. Cy-1792]|uniref:hypothetical protein n=1 Tax=Chitinophaga sp. Cy-1792 TaxID=2608339 RepID=UPI001420F887|nr:hypothetical protein [Chitinophaga sp. Cy-1792]NIG57554.1 hypothetical protein [Chitinophaga sp. Cy-1792]
MKLHLSGLCLCLLFALPMLAQQKKEELHFTSNQRQLITVYKGTIFVNGNKAYVFKEDKIKYASKRNRLIEDGRTAFLFLEVTDTPNKDKLIVFNIDHSLADSLLTAISSDVKDWDRDDNLEFGGSEAPVPYAAADSMYYLPSRWYEIRKGKISYDAELTETVDKKVNGQFIADAPQRLLIPKKKGKN